MAHPLTPGVTVILTRHLGPYLAAVRGEMTLAAAAERSAVLDRIDSRSDDVSAEDRLALPKSGS